MQVDTSIKTLDRAAERDRDHAGRLTRQLGKSEIDLRIPMVRDAGLPWRYATDGALLGAEAVLRAARAACAGAGAFLVGGGEPLERDDLWEILAELASLRSPNLGLCTAGHGMGQSVADRLRACGVKRIQIPFHCARQDAHDWLVGRPGALKTALRAIRACVEADLAVAAEIVVTRPTMPHLAETVEVLARIGVRSVCVRRLAAEDAAGTTFVPLSPRFSLLEKHLEDAAAVAMQKRLSFTLRDLPLCVAPRLRPFFAKPESEVWVMPDGGLRLRTETGPGCATCPGTPQCAGAPLDYVSRFGWEEFTDAKAAEERVYETVTQQIAATPSEPMVFGWRAPHRVRCEACADRVEAGAADSAYESTRVVRARLVEASRRRPSRLRLVGGDLLAHPQAALLIFDALRLFPHVEVAGEASAIVDWTENDMRRLKDLQRLDVALYGPDAATHDAHCGIPGAFAATLRGVESLRRGTEITVGAYAIVHEARVVPAFVEAWTTGLLPGQPRFRLSARGGSLDELVELAKEMPSGPAQAALMAVLPRCLCESAGIGLEGRGGDSAVVDYERSQQTIHYGRSMPYDPCGSDPIGAFESCSQRGAESCTVPGCVGMASGWLSTARSERWMASH